MTPIPQPVPSQPGARPQSANLPVDLAGAANAAAAALDNFVTVVAHTHGSVDESDLHDLARARAIVHQLANHRPTGREPAQRPSLHEAINSVMPRRPQR
jgi:hypothetical protein